MIAGNFESYLIKEFKIFIQRASEVSKVNHILGTEQQNQHGSTNETIYYEVCSKSFCCWCWNDKGKFIFRFILDCSPDPTTNSETTNPEFKTIFLVDQISSEKKTNKLICNKLTSKT